MNADNKSFWQRFAKLYSPFMEKGNKQLYEDICIHIKPTLNKQMDVLELACGSGQFSFRLASYAKTWEATDFSPNMIAEAKKHISPAELTFSVQDATNLPYTDCRYDVVLIANALHIMPHPERALKEIIRVLKPGGVLLAPTFVHGKGAGFRLRAKLLEAVGFHVYSKWSNEEFATYIAEHGFAVTEVKQFGGSIVPLCYLAAQKSIK